METFAIAATVIVGFVNGVRLAANFRKDPWPFILFLCGLGAGILFGFLHYYGLTIESGIAVAIGGSGVYQIAKKVGGQ